MKGHSYGAGGAAPLPNVTTPPLSVGGRLKPDTGHDKYIDWMEDDTERDPTPSNKRRAEMVRATRPTPKTDMVADSHGKIMNEGTTGGVLPGGLPRY